MYSTAQQSPAADSLHAIVRYLQLVSGPVTPAFGSTWEECIVETDGFRVLYYCTDDAVRFIQLEA